MSRGYLLFVPAEFLGEILPSAFLAEVGFISFAITAAIYLTKMKLKDSFMEGFIFGVATTVELLNII